MSAPARSRVQAHAPRRSHEGAFLLYRAQPQEVFTPEDFDEDDRTVAQSARSFFDEEVAPAEAALERHDYALLRRLLVRAGEAGFLATGVPEAEGGLGFGLVPTMIETEQFSRNASFTMAIANQTGIGSLPLLFYGTAEQKRRYLPGIMSGETVLAFALTEAHSGSDALSPRTTARLDASGEFYVLNGEKLWVTNAAIADLITVFAQVDGKHLAVFLVEGNWPGINFGAEEVKLGVRGSSTRPLILQDVRVPVENLLGDVGLGHRVAFGTLNIGRARLGAGLVGASKEVLSLAARYAAQRVTFGRPISQYGLIQHKLADIAARVYAAESIVYRTAGLLTPQVAAMTREGVGALPGGITFAAECSAVKVFGSELYSYASDEGVQIHGGNGYSEAYPIERHYRDSRVTRIFEGTNEIHRLLITERLIKLATSGALPLLETAKSIQAEASNGWNGTAARKNDEPEPLENEIDLTDRVRDVAVLALEAAVTRFGPRLAEQQVLVGALSDMVIEAFATDSVVSRTIKATGLESREELSAREQTRLSATSLFVGDAFERAMVAARTAAGVICEGGSAPHFQMAVERAAVSPLIDRAAISAQISTSCCETGGYPL
jgi:hypothetical protein